MFLDRGSNVIMMVPRAVPLSGMTHARLPCRARWLALATVLLSPAIGAPAAVSAGENPPVIPKVESLARRLVPVAVTGGPVSYTISLRNEYSRAVAACVVSQAGLGRVSAELTSGGIAPGAILEIRFNVPEVSADGRHARNRGNRAAPIEIEAVVFDDGTSDGEFLAINGLMGQRAGRAAQVRRVLASLREAGALDDATLRTGLEEVLAKVSSLSVNLYGGAYDTQAFDARDVSAGLIRARGEIVRDLARLLAVRRRAPPATSGEPKSPARMRQELTVLIDRYEQFLKDLRITTGM